MRSIARTLMGALVLGGAVAASGCVVAPPRTYVAVAPARVWVPGYWGYGHVWVGGYWRVR